MNRQTTPQDIIEASRIFWNQSCILTFDDHGILQMPNGKKITRECSQRHRGIQAAIVDCLLVNDPKGQKFTATPQENLTDLLSELADSLSDASDDPPDETLNYMSTDMRLSFRALVEGRETEVQETMQYDENNWIDLWADILRFAQKHKDHPQAAEYLPIERHRPYYPDAFAFFDKHKARIIERAHKKDQSPVRKDYTGTPSELRAKSGFWSSVRIQIAAEPSLLSEARKYIITTTPTVSSPMAMHVYWRGAHSHD